MNNVLIVDDQSSIRRIYSNLLVQEGFNVVGAINASDANEVLKHQKIDLVLLDLRMPEVNGSILYEVIQMFHKRVKVVVSSVYNLDKQRRMVPGATDYFDKAQGIDALILKVKEALGISVFPAHSVCSCPALEG